MDRKREKMSITATVGDLFEELNSQINYFLVHRYVKRKQAVHMEKLINECDGKSIYCKLTSLKMLVFLHRMKFNQLTGTIFKQQSLQHMHGLMRIITKALPLYQII